MNTMYGQSVTGAYPQTMGSSYPINVQYARQESYNRFWAIPVVGIVVKAIILIPHFIVLSVLGAVVMLLQLVTWIPVLTAGQFPEWSYNLAAGFLRWYLRVSAFLFGLSDTYPAFSLQDTPQDTQTIIPLPTNPNRMWAVPVIGILIKAILVIPHYIILYVLGIIVELLQLVTWIPVLFGGQYPEWGENLVGGYLRWNLRYVSYLLGLTDIYPPFQLSA
jgi:hypothetical protein